MALENSEVLDNLKKQLKEVSEQYETLATTRLKLLGAIDVLEQIEDSNKEIAVVIVGGKGTIEFQSKEFSFDRPDWISSDPTVVHMSAGENVKISTKSQSRIAVIKTINNETFKGKIYLPEEIDTEHRGKDQLDDTCYRLVRLAFDAVSYTHLTLPTKA